MMSNKTIVANFKISLLILIRLNNLLDLKLACWLSNKAVHLKLNATSVKLYYRLNFTNLANISTKYKFPLKLGVKYLFLKYGSVCIKFFLEILNKFPLLLNITIINIRHRNFLTRITPETMPNNIKK